MSANFLVQILNDLRRAGLVDSRRGKAGGYLLGRPAKEITLREIVMAVDPALLQFSVSNEGESGPGVRSAWERVSIALGESLEGVTLATLTQQVGAPMFYI